MTLTIISPFCGLLDNRWRRFAPPAHACVPHIDGAPVATQGVPSRGKAEVDLAVAADGGSKCVVVESLDDLKVIQYDAGPPPETDEESQQREKEQETKRAASKRAISRRPLKKQARREKTQYRVDRLLARQEINGVDSYLVQWSGYTHEYTDWIPAADVTVRAIEMFNPPPGAPGEHTESSESRTEGMEQHTSWWSSMLTTEVNHTTTSSSSLK